MINIKVTEDYAPLIPFFIENELEFEEGEAYGEDEIIKCWRADSTTLIGGCILAKREGEYICDGIAVSQELRSDGLGKKMLDLLINEVKAMGGERIYLVARAPGFFAKSGFVSVERADAPKFFECFTCPQYDKTCHPEVMRLDVAPETPKTTAEPKKTEAKRKKNKKPITPQRIILGCLRRAFNFFTIAALVCVIADKLVLKGSLSFWIINSMIANKLGQFVLQFETNFFFPLISKMDFYVFIIPVALVLINIFVIRLIKHHDRIKIVSRQIVYFCLMLFVGACSLTILYTDYAVHLADKFIPGEQIKMNNLDDLTKIVSKSKDTSQHVIDTVLLELKFASPGMIDRLSDSDYIEAGRLVAASFQLKGTVKSVEEHYLRNSLDRAPETLDDMLKAIKEGNPYGWTLLAQEDTVYHMQGKDGEFNVKFVSEDGFNEAIYNKAGVLLTEKNDPVNMGTFNYASPTGDPALHLSLDILPYYAYGNCPASPTSSSENYDYENNPAAQKRWNDLKAQIDSYQSFW